MKISVALLSAGLAVGAVSCGSTSTPATTSDNQPIRGSGSGTETVAAPGRPQQPTAVNNPPSIRIDGDAPGKDAQFTIFCDALRGENHVLAATKIKDKLVAKTGMTAWHIVHSNDQSAIYYGYYSTFSDKEHFPAETARAQGDLHKIEALTNDQGDRLFVKAIFLPINNPDPDAPQQWNLANTPPTAYWSLQIAAFRGFPERKQAAVEAVRMAREKGIEAYYYHGETISSVCIGAWPKDSIKTQDMQDAGTANPDDIPIVTDQPLPPGVIQNMHDREGHRLTIEAPKLEVQDGTLMNAIRQYPEHAVNYEVTVQYYKDKDGKTQERRSPSLLVRIPHTDAGTSPAPVIPLPPADSASAGADRAANDIIENRTGGHLKSIDEK